MHYNSETKELKCFLSNSLNFIGHVILVFSSPLEKKHKDDADKEEEDEAQHWSSCRANDHSHFIGWNHKAQSENVSKIKRALHKDAEPEKLFIFIQEAEGFEPLWAAYGRLSPGWWSKSLIQLCCSHCTRTSLTCCCSSCSTSTSQSSHLKQQGDSSQQLLQNQPHNHCHY